MISSIRRRIRAWHRPDCRLRCQRQLWDAVLAELARRGAGHRESGAFLLGRIGRLCREIQSAVYYDDLAPDALASGAILVPGSVYGMLWHICRDRKQQVVADIHTHPGVARQSYVDREHPMISQPGHIALIVPHLARHHFLDDELGIYEYLGPHAWRNHSGQGSTHVLRIVR